MGLHDVITVRQKGLSSSKSSWMITSPPPTGHPLIVIRDIPKRQNDRMHPLIDHQPIIE